jgi:nucleotidyltransferase substrate binding protein (TIGR01987 family)
MKQESKLQQSMKDLGQALTHRAQALQEHIYYAGIAKCFEVCLEYAWKELKRRLENEGLEAYSPKEIVKAAGRAGMIDDVETWLLCINVRNIAVHDYLGVTPEEYLTTIEKFLKLVSRLS